MNQRVPAEATKTPALQLESALSETSEQGHSIAPPPFQLLVTPADGDPNSDESGELACCIEETGSPIQTMRVDHQPIQRQEDPKPKKKTFYFNVTKDMKGEEFQRMVNMRLFGKHPGPGKWTGLKDDYKKRTKPYGVNVDISLLKKHRSKDMSDLGVKVDKEGKIEGADKRAGDYEGMKPGKGKDAITKEIDKRYSALTGEKVNDNRLNLDKDLWTQVRDELLVEKQFVENLPAKVKLIIQHSPDGIKLEPKDYGQVARIARKIAKMDVADLENYLRGVKKTDSLDVLEKSVERFLEQKVAGKEKIREVMKLEKDDDWDVDDETAKLTTTQMFYLSLAQRKKLIDNISDGFRVGDEDENTLIRLLVSAPADQQKGLLAWLKKDKSKILKRLESVIDGSENKEYYAALRNLVFQTMKPEDAAKKMENAKILPWADPGLIKAAYNVRYYYETVEYTDDGRVKVEYWVNLAMFGKKTTTQYFDPDEIIGLYFFMDENFANATEGQTIYMPASNLISFYNEQFSRELSLVVDVGLLAAGGAGLLAKGGRLAKAVAALDLTLATADIVINSFRQDIAKTKAGKDFLRAWDTVNTLIAVYGLARLVIAMPEAFKNFRKAYHNFKSSKHGLGSDDMKKLDGEAQKLLKESEVVTFEKRLQDLRAKHTPEELKAFEKQLEDAAGLADAKKKSDAVDVIESQIAAQNHNVELVKKLREQNPNATTREIAKLATPNLKVPGVPMGYTKDEWVEVQAWVKQYLEGKGFKVKKGFATGSRITGATFNPSKTKTFGKRKTDFKGVDLDITVVTDKKIPNNKLKEFKKAFKEKFKKELGVRPLPESQIQQLDHIPIFGKIDMNF